MKQATFTDVRNQAKHYFDLVETPVVEELEWLGPSRS